MSKLRLLVCVMSLSAVLLGCGGSQPPVRDVAPAMSAPAASAAATAPGAPGAPAWTDKIAITSLDQLPQHTYAIAGSASALLHDDAAFTAFAAKVRADLESDLARYQVDDPATLQGWYGNLANLALLDGRWDDAVRYLDQVTALETKESTRLVGGQVGRALAAAHATLGPDPDPEALRAEFRRQLAARIDPLPWDIVQDTVEKNKGQAEYLSANLIEGIVQANMDPIVAQSGGLGSDLARGLIGMQAALTVILPLQRDLASVYGDYIAANRVEKRNIWPEREVALPAGKDLAPVMVGIWDSGVERSVFGAMFTNPSEPGRPR